MLHAMFGRMGEQSPTDSSCCMKRGSGTKCALCSILMSSQVEVTTLSYQFTNNHDTLRSELINDTKVMINTEVRIIDVHIGL